MRQSDYLLVKDEIWFEVNETDYLLFKLEIWFEVNETDYLLFKLEIWLEVVEKGDHLVVLPEGQEGQQSHQRL